MVKPKVLEEKLVEEEVKEAEKKEEVKEEVVEEKKEEEVVEEEVVEEIPLTEEEEANKKAIEEGDKEAKEDIADLLSITDDEKKGKEDEDKGVEEKVEEEKKKEVVEEKKEKVVEEEEDPLLVELGRLTEQIMGVETPPKKEEGKEEKVVEEKVEVKQEEDILKEIITPVQLEDQAYVSPEMFKDSLDDTDRKQFNTILNQVVKQVREDTRSQTMQDAMKIFPAMMDYKVQGFMAAQEFWKNNNDLDQLCTKYPKVKKYVQYRSTEIQRQNPNFTLGDVYKETEKEVRELLKDRLTKQKAQADSDAEKVVTQKPGLVRKPGAGRKTPIAKPSRGMSEQEEIMDLINFDR